MRYVLIFAVFFTIGHHVGGKHKSEPNKVEAPTTDMKPAERESCKPVEPTPTVKRIFT